MASLADIFRIGIFFILLIFSAYADLKEYKIPDSLTICVTLIGLILAFMLNNFPGVLVALLSFLMGYLPFRFLNNQGVFGKGDAKLMGAVGCLTSPAFLIKVFWYTALSGFVLALIFLFIRKELLSGLKRSVTLLLNITNKTKREKIIAEGERITIPYGVAIAAGAYIAFFSSL